MHAPPSLRDKAHARVYQHWMELPAWRDMSTHGRALYLEIAVLYRPSLPNEFAFSLRKVQRLLNCSHGTAKLALDELEQFGWIEVERVGSMHGTKSSRASTFSLTNFPSASRNATRAFERYKRPQRSNIHAPTREIVSTNGLD